MRDGATTSGRWGSGSSGGRGPPTWKNPPRRRSPRERRARPRAQRATRYGVSQHLQRVDDAHELVVDVGEVTALAHDLDEDDTVLAPQQDLPAVPEEGALRRVHLALHGVHAPLTD